MYKAVLFDLDGTLTDSGPGLMRSVQYALEKIGHPEDDLEALRCFVGPPLLEQFMEFAGIDEETARTAIEYYRERYVPVGMFENELYPGVTDLLDELSQKGYILAVASSKPEKYVVEILKYFGIEGYFSAVVGSELNETRTKKNEVVEEALHRLGLSDRPEEAVMVGDKSHDIIGARMAGVECLAVSYGYGTMEELTSSDPLRIVRSPYEAGLFFQ